MNHSISRILLSLLVIALACTGCEGSQAAPSPPSAATPAVTATPISTPTAPSQPTAAKIIFVGKQNACECTRKAIDATWAVLQQAVGTPARLPVQRLQLDTDGEQVEVYRMVKPIMALPAIYFLDGQGQVLELLQGEVTAAQITGILNR